MKRIYDFTTVTPRYQMGSNKWDEMKEVNPEVAEDVIPFSVADMEFKTAPEIVEGLKEELDTKILGYTNADDNYKEAVCGWMKKRYGWDARPEWILPSHGVVDAFFTAVKAFTNPGEGVILMTPVYYPMYSAIQRNDRVLEDCPLIRTEDTYVIDYDKLEELASKENTRLLILCSPHNPCGRVWTSEELLKVGDICMRNRVMVVSDEIHADILMPGHKHRVFADLREDFAEHCIICTSPSKTFNIAGLQTTNVFAPNPEIRAAFYQELRKNGSNPKCNALGYAACRIAYQKGEAWLEEMLEVIWNNYNLVRDFMNQYLPQVRVYRMEGTYLLWMDWNGLGLDYKELEKKNRMEAQLFFDEGYVFGKAGEGFVRWNLACPTSCIEKALERIRNVYVKG